MLHMLIISRILAYFLDEVAKSGYSDMLQFLYS